MNAYIEKNILQKYVFHPPILNSDLEKLTIVWDFQKSFCDLRKYHKAIEQPSPNITRVPVIKLY